MNGNVKNKVKRIILSEEESMQLNDFREIKKIWTANVSHFSNKYKSVRHHSEDNRTTVYKGWQGMIGYLRFYLWMFDHNYQIGKNELKRIEENKGFYPENLQVVEKRKQRKDTVAKTKQLISKEKNAITNIVTNSKNLENYLLIEDKKITLQLAFNMLEQILLSEQHNINLDQLKET